MEDQTDDNVKLIAQKTTEIEQETVESSNKNETLWKGPTTQSISTDKSVNVTETNAQGNQYGQDHELQEKGSLISDIKVEVITLMVKKNEKHNEPQMKKKATLLEQALSYRQENPEKWQQSQVDRVRQVEESYGIYQEDPFIEAYYKRLAELKIETEKMEEIRKTLPATISYQIQFNNPRKRKSNPVETYASMSADGISVFDNHDNSFFDRFKSHKDDERGKEPELLITVSKGKNLHNALNNEKLKLKNCRLKCKFYPDSLKHGPKMKTSYVHCNLKGTTRWNHVFVLKGFTAKELATKHIVLELVGKTEEGKVVLGETILAGRQARISRKGSDSTRPPMPEECGEWDQVIRNPGNCVTVTADMAPSRIGFEKEGLSTTLAGKMKQEFNSSRSLVINNNSKSLSPRKRPNYS